MEFNPRKVLIVGNGAVVNGSQPLIHSMLDLEGVAKSYHDRTLANFPIDTLASTAFMHRAFRAKLIRALRNPTQFQDESVAGMLTDLLRINKIRMEIADSYREAVSKGMLELHREVDIVKRELDFKLDGIITTNWDELFTHRYQLVQNIVCLHGRVSAPDTLILPTEMACDDRIFNEDIHLLKLLDQAVTEAKFSHEDVLSAFGRAGGASEIEHAHFLAMSWLEQTQDIIVWGLGIHHYDAELAAVLRSAHKSRQKLSLPPINRVMLIDTEPRKINLVAHIFSIEPDKIEFIEVNKS